MTDGELIWAEAMTTILGEKLLPEYDTAEGRTGIAAKIIEVDASVSQMILKEIFGDQQER